MPDQHELDPARLAQLDQRAAGWFAQLDQLVREVRDLPAPPPGGDGGMIAIVASFIRSRVNGPDPGATVAVLAAAAVLRLAHPRLDAAGQAPAPATPGDGSHPGPPTPTGHPGGQATTGVDTDA